MAQEEGKNRPNKITKQIEFEDEEDQISSLPDCLLIEIISRFDLTIEAIKTSTLSKRWQHLWTQLPNLIFHRKNTHSTTKFFSIMDKTLAQCSRQSTLTRFVLNAGYDTQFENLLNNWIHYAINRNVQEIDLSLGAMTESPFVLDQLIFTNSCFTHLRFGGCRLNPTRAISWKNLKSLSFSHGKLDEGVIQNILSGSPLLETFKLAFCYGFRRLDITSKSVKNLVLYGYFFEHVILINAPYISSLTIRGKLAIKKLLFINLTSLLEANLNFWMWWGMHLEVEEMLKCVVLNLQHVKEIKIGYSCLNVLYRLKAKGFTRPTNVKYVHCLDYGVLD